MMTYTIKSHASNPMCRKAMLFSKVVITAGVIWILAYLLGAIRFEPTTMIGALAAIMAAASVLAPIGAHQSNPRLMKCAEMRRAKR